MDNDIKESQIKICRACHTVYKKLTQKYCGNGCERKEPFLINGQPNLDIEPREQIVTPNPENIIRWMCVQCHTEYRSNDVSKPSFECKECKAINDLIPFTIKACANCVNKDGTIHGLALEAKACDLCSKSEFLLNNNIRVTNLKYQKTPNTQEKKEETSVIKGEASEKKEMEDWSGPEAVVFNPPPKEGAKDTNQISLTLTLLNNNLEIKLFAESKTFSLKDIIRSASGYVPESIYERLLKQYPNQILEIQFKEGAFYLRSPLSLNYAELDLKFQRKGPAEKWDENKNNPLEESKLYEFKTDFLKFLVWVY